MPLSVRHASLLLLFQNRPTLALELLHAMGVESMQASSATVENVDLTAAVPAEYRTDLVVRYEGGTRPLIVVVEVQLTPDENKRYSWPAYVVLLRARFRCEVRLLVVAPDRKLARWCARPIDLGNGAVLTPTVLGSELIPVVTDRERARAAPELTVLSALAHGRGNVEQATAIGLAGLHAVEGLEEERGMLYFDLVLSALGEAARKAIDEMIPRGYEWQSDIVRKLRADGKAEGKAEGEARAIVAVLEARGIELAPAERERILGCGDLAVLDVWIRRSITVATSAELFV